MPITTQGDKTVIRCIDGDVFFAPSKIENEKHGLVVFCDGTKAPIGVPQEDYKGKKLSDWSVMFLFETVQSIDAVIASLNDLKDVRKKEGDDEKQG